MKALLLSAILALISTTAAIPAFAQSTGRYQAIPLPPTRVGAYQELPNVLILDTVAGHMWLWHQEVTSIPTKRDEIVTVETFLNYQGVLRAGKRAGELIEKW
jgi:hypothetical protein